ncbi:hypothetical protein LguiA_023435 [Lonicera macranthoides]
MNTHIKVWKSDRNSIERDEKESSEERTNQFDPWSARNQWENNSRGRISFDIREPAKILEIDTSRTCSYHIPMSQNQTTIKTTATALCCLFTTQQINPPFLYIPQPPTTPSPKPKPLQVRSASPRRLKEEKSYSTD